MTIPLQITRKPPTTITLPNQHDTEMVLQEVEVGFGPDLHRYLRYQDRLRSVIPPRGYLEYRGSQPQPGDYRILITYEQVISDTYLRGLDEND